MAQLGINQRSPTQQTSTLPPELTLRQIEMTGHCHFGIKRTTFGPAVVKIITLFSVAVKRIREIMNGADINSNPHSHAGVPQPQRMPVPSPMPTPAFNQPLAIFDRQPLPPGVSIIELLFTDTSIFYTVDQLKATKIYY